MVFLVYSGCVCVNLRLMSGTVGSSLSCSSQCRCRSLGEYSSEWVIVVVGSGAVLIVAVVSVFVRCSCIGCVGVVLSGDSYTKWCALTCLVACSRCYVVSLLSFFIVARGWSRVLFVRCMMVSMLCSALCQFDGLVRFLIVSWMCICCAPSWCGSRIR